MKRKLLSILVALIACISPVLFFSGCSGNTDQGVDLKYTTWSVEVGGKFSESTVTGLEITYSNSVYNKDTGKYEDKEQETITDLATAISKGLSAIGGFDSSKVGTYTMTVMFGGERFEIKYTVTDTAGGESEDK